MSKTAKNSIKILIILLSIGFIFYKIIKYNDLNTALEEILSFNFEKTIILTFIFLLMPVNWGIEAIKWRFLLKDVESLSFLKSIQGVFIGVTSAFFTPNRIGELGGRVLVLRKENRIKGIFCTGVGSLSQLSITLTMGMLSLAGFALYVPAISEKLQIPSYFLAILALLLLFLCLYAYFNFAKVGKVLAKIKFLKKKNYLDPAFKYSRKDLLKVLLAGLFRYFIFSSQFYLLLYIFGIRLNFLEGFGSIALIYLISSFIPSISLTEFGIRGTTGIIIINFFSPQIPAIISTSITLWLINLALPAIFGTIIFYKSKI